MSGCSSACVSCLSIQVESISLLRIPRKGFTAVPAGQVLSMPHQVQLHVNGGSLLLHNDV